MKALRPQPDALRAAVGVGACLLVEVVALLRREDSLAVVTLLPLLGSLLVTRSDLHKWAVRMPGGGGVEAEMKAVERMTGAARLLGTPVVPEGASQLERRGGASPQGVNAAAARSAALDPEVRRKAVERLMAAAAQWGWWQGKAGRFTAPPTPYIEWHGDEPRILFGTSDRTINEADR